MFVDRGHVLHACRGRRHARMRVRVAVSGRGDSGSVLGPWVLTSAIVWGRPTEKAIEKLQCPRIHRVILRGAVA